jgi:hypothetical protein
MRTLVLAALGLTAFIAATAALAHSLAHLLS